jgi:hypothetical protein
MGDMKDNDLRRFAICHLPIPSIIAVYANVRRQKSMRLRKGHFPLGAFYWDFVVTNLDDSPACSQACFQAVFDRVKK